MGRHIETANILTFPPAFSFNDIFAKIIANTVSPADWYMLYVKACYTIHSMLKSMFSHMSDAKKRIIAEMLCW